MRLPSARISRLQYGKPIVEALSQHVQRGSCPRIRLRHGLLDRAVLRRRQNHRFGSVVIGDHDLAPWPT